MKYKQLVYNMAHDMTQYIPIDSIQGNTFFFQLILLLLLLVLFEHFFFFLVFHLSERWMKLK